jgi:hypothetical protein
MRKIIFILVMNGLLLGIFVTPLSKIYAEYKLEDQLDVSIIMNIKWETVPGADVGIREQGSCSIQASGK